MPDDVELLLPVIPKLKTAEASASAADSWPEILLVTREDELVWSAIVPPVMAAKTGASLMPVTSMAISALSSLLRSVRVYVKRSISLSPLSKASARLAV